MSTTENQRQSLFLAKKQALQKQRNQRKKKYTEKKKFIYKEFRVEQLQSHIRGKASRYMRRPLVI
jgi:hypothetical protein